MGKDAPLSAARREGPGSGVGLVRSEVKGEKDVDGTSVCEVEVDSVDSGDHQEIFTPEEVLLGVMKPLGDIVSGDDLGLLGERELSPPEEEGFGSGWDFVDVLEVVDAEGGVFCREIRD